MDIIYYLIALFVSMIVHEYMHALVAYKLGDMTAQHEGRLTLNPFVHIDPFYTLLLPLLLILSGSPIVFGAAKPVPFNPYMVKGGKYGAALVGLAGPLSNLVIATVFGIFLRLFPDTSLYGLYVSFIYLNLGFFVFNMIPFPPLDGSRVLYAFASEKLMEVMEKIESMGLMGIFFFMFIAYQFISPLIYNLVSWLASLITGGIL